MIDNGKEVILGDQLPENEVSKIENSVIHGYKDFEFITSSETLKMRVFHPSNTEQEKIADVYSNEYTRMLKEGKILLWDAMLVELRKAGVWSQEDDNVQEFTTEEMKNAVRDYLSLIRFEGYDKEIAKRHRESYFKAKEKLERYLEKRSKYYSNTIESKANEIALQYKILYCVKKELNGEYVQLFSKIEEIQESRTLGLMGKIIAECLPFWAGIPQELLNVAPEDDIFFGGKGLHTLLDNLNGKWSGESIKTEEKVSSELNLSTTPGIS